MLRLRPFKLEENGHCEEPDNFYPMVAFDESGVVGHFIMRYIHGDNRVLRFKRHFLWQRSKKVLFTVSHTNKPPAK